MTKLAALALIAFLTSCSSSKSDTPPPPSNNPPPDQGGQQQPPPGPSPYIDGFTPPAAPAGYQRFVTPVIKALPPGSDTMWCQYIAAPFDKDTDVIDLVGSQSKGGHHLILYGTDSAQPVGTSRECNSGDMLSVHYLGAIGGETGGFGGKDLPDGTVFRAPKGLALIANAHFINTTDHPIDAQAVIDVKLADADPSKKVITLFANAQLDFNIPANQSAQADATCVVQQDMDVFFFGNHMHGYGTSIYSQVERTSGEKTSLRADPTWLPEMEFNPQFARWTLSAPMHINKGDTVRTHCAWQNTTGSALSFPTEMCVGFAFFIGQTEVDCVNGQWPH